MGQLEGEWNKPGMPLQRFSGKFWSWINLKKNVNYTNIIIIIIIITAAATTTTTTTTSTTTTAAACLLACLLTFSLLTSVKSSLGGCSP